MSVVAERKAKVQPRPVSWRRAARRNPVWRVVKRVGFYLLVAAIFVYALFPFYWVIRSAFTPEADLFVTPVRYIPVHPTFENFHRLFADTGDDVGGAEIVAVELLGIGHVEFANEAGGAHREGLQRILHTHGELGGHRLAIDGLCDGAHVTSLNSEAV